MDFDRTLIGAANGNGANDFGCAFGTPACDSSRVQDFRRLRVWRKASGLAINTRRATERFPRSGYAELKAQIVSAAESVVINIVEGCGASSQKDFARFLSISIKSAMELEGELELARGYGIMPEADWLARQTEIIETRQMLHSLRKKVLGADLS